MKDDYHKSLVNNSEHFEKYYKKSFQKTEQQKFLEKLLLKNETIFSDCKIADIACGGGSLSYHLNSIFKNAEFYLADYNQNAIDLAKQNNNFPNFNFFEDDIYELRKFDKNFFDFVFCWQTLSWLDRPQDALNSLLSITKPGGKLYLSSLFNLDYDVDVYSKIKDYSNEKNVIDANYNTYSLKSINNWLNGKVKNFNIVPFQTTIDFEYSGRGIGTYTINSERGKLQFSAGMHLNWGVLVIEK
jgi:ubiquinone/menaquinone biosynthesis C-methylase UbiE